MIFMRGERRRTYARDRAERLRIRDKARSWWNMVGVEREMSLRCNLKLV